MTTHLPTRPARPIPDAAPWDLMRSATRTGLDVVTVGGECLLCGTTEARDWTPAALDGLRHRHGPADVFVGWVCFDCRDEAERIADQSRLTANRTAVRRIERT